MSFSQQRAQQKLKPDPVEVAPGSEPLKSRKHEKAVQFYVDNNSTKTAAYQKGLNSKSKGATLSSAASALFRKPEVKARVEFLQRKQDLKTDPAPAEEPTLFDEIPDLDALLLEQYNLARNAGTDTARSGALEKLIARMEKQQESSAAGALDPVLLAQHLTNYAGWPGDRIAKEIGGLRFIAEKCCDILKVSPGEWIAALEQAAQSPSQ